MRTLLATMVMLMMLFSQVQAEDMGKYFKDTKEMVRQGKYKEALERFIWFHDHALEHEPAMYGVRLSYALDSWKALGEVYPPAKKAFLETRDRKTHQLKKGEGDSSLFHDVASLNRTLQEEGKTVELFKILDKENPTLAKKSWNVAKDYVIDAKCFDLARKYLGNLVREFTSVKAMYDRNVTLYDDPRIGGKDFKAYNENNFVEESLRLIQVAVALGDKEAAKEIQKQALMVANDNRIHNAVKTDKKENAKQDNSGVNANQLKKHVLSKNHLPDGFSFVQGVEKNNREAAKEASLIIDRPDDWLKRYESWGRISGYSVAFMKQNNTSIEIISSEVEEYRTFKGATSGLLMAMKIGESKSLLEKALKSFGIQLETIETKKAPFRGDNGIFVFAKGTLIKAGSTIPSEIVQIIWIKDIYVYAVSWVVMGVSSIFDSDVVKLAQLQNQL
ncbi:MAG: hypothetical protein MUO31_09940 [Thermodesulfovibrionales bacterium]|nr:hypothetical protein [Thermodesulfovibrionales bacterium]